MTWWQILLIFLLAPSLFVLGVCAVCMLRGTPPGPRTL
jgi:hypothetical protein